MTKVLIISYVFPPTGGAGVARSIKLAKYLPDFGMTPAVLTVANPSVPVVDPSLLGELSPDLEVLRVRTFEPGYALKQAAWTAGAASTPGQPAARSLRQKARGIAVKAAKSLLIPDPQVLWQPAAALALTKRLLRRADDVVWITGPPYSPFMLAPLVRARSGVGVVLDYRDEWSTLRSAYEMRAPATARLVEKLEHRLVHSAHAITTVTPAFRQGLLETNPSLLASQVHVIENGFDPSDFPSDMPQPPADRFVITYAGTVFSLTRPSGFLDALRLLWRQHPQLAKHLDVQFIGRIVATELEAFRDAESIGITRLGYMAKKAVTQKLAASHLNLCTLSSDDEARRIYPGKIFELMALGRPVLTLAPQGILTALVKKHHVGVCFEPDAAVEIAADLTSRLRSFLAGTYSITTQCVDIDRFHRRALAGRMASVLTEAIERARH